MWPRRQALRALGATLALPALTPAFAQFRVEISGVGATQIPIALGRFRDEDRQPQSISAIVRADLERSGIFKIVDAPAPADESGVPDYNTLRGRGADWVVAGSATRLADGKVDVRFRLWDVVKGADQGGQSEPTLPVDMRLSAHHVSDQIYQKITGERGIFSTRIAYVTKAPGKFTLRITDADGENIQAALIDNEPIISPSWSPDGSELAYVTFHDRKAKVVIRNIRQGSTREVAAFKGSNSAPAFSPDGRTLAVTLSRDGGSHVYLMDRNGANVRRVTDSTGIDTEAKFSPDGASLYFVSDRGGGPQIYRQPVGGGGATRVTFNGAYNISPALSPDGKLLAYISRGSGFKVMVMDLGTNEVRSVSDTNADESPSFAPNGRYIIYATKADGRDVLMTTTVDGKFKSKLLESGLDIREPVWGPYGR
ncbi:MAG: Tol-Pal system beta propeller repeat protein TolB [Burkholderiaceae bacterium]